MFAAGNAGPGQDTLNPYSASPCAISVAAGDTRGFLADFSSRGIPGDKFHKHEFTLSVPSGYGALRIVTSWANPAEDLDLYVYDPQGNLVASSATLSVPEQVIVPNPQAGSWKVVMEGYLNTNAFYQGLAEGDKLVRVRRVR